MRRRRGAKEAPVTHTAFTRAIEAQKAGNIPLAITLFHRAVEEMPSDARPPHDLGMLLLEQGNVEQASRFLALAVQRAPDIHRTWASLGHAFVKQGKFAEARTCYHQALEINQDFTEGWLNLGRLHVGMGASDLAERAFLHVLRLAPATGAAYVFLGDIARERSNYAAAIPHYQQAIELLPAGCGEAILAHWMLGLCYLALGDYARGWPEYEWRLESTLAWHHSEWNKALPPWDGIMAPDLKLVVHYEQGLGDTLQFVRYLPVLTRLGIDVTLVAQPSLLPLLHRQSPALAARLCDGSAGAPGGDAHVSLLSLPHCLSPLLNGAIPETTPYLTADADASRRWRQRLEERAGGRQLVGLVWAGNPHHQLDRLRSIPFEQMRPLLDLENTAFVSLQFGAAAEEARAAGHPNLLDVSAELADFDASAALVDALDGIISVDTAPAHLAGAMGKPLALLLASYSDWRWGRGHAQRSPWYPTARLYRQCQGEAWPAVVARVAEGLRNGTLFT